MLLHLRNTRLAAWPRRKRRILYTLVMTGLFIGTVGLVIGWFSQPPAPKYRPGESIEGLTSVLDRSLPPDAPRIHFSDVTQAAGIDFHHFSGRRSSQLPEDMGSGAAWGDYDNDGWLDLYLVNFAGPLTLSPGQLAASPARNALYRNRGDGTFEEVAVEAGVDFRGYGMGAAWGDYDNDGWLDLFVTAYGRNVFYRNNGDDTFADHTVEAGLGGQEGFWAGASWGDYNRDGWLDLYVTGYVRYASLDAGPVTSLQYDIEAPASINPSSFPPERNLLYRNDGDGTFTEVGRLAGVDNPQGRSLSAAWSDLDADGWPDLYVANDVSDNVLYRNLGNGLFEEISHRALVADYRGAMGIAVGDWDLDEDLDLFITHWIAQENALYNNQTANLPGKAGPVQLRFMDVADRFGLGQIALDYIGWGTFFFDYDNDGRLDLFVANGSTFQQRKAPHLLVPMKSQLFWNGGVERGFFDVSAVSGAFFEMDHVSRGAASGDYDNDGDPDLVVINHNGPAVLLRNEGGQGKSWLQVDVRQHNRSAIGARVRVVAGDRIQIREVGSQSSYCSQNSPVVHFGLSDVQVVDTLEVRWPDGALRTLTRIPARQKMLIRDQDEATS